ncbi:MAG: cytochrome c-type biogenesis protein [Gaiella sp.]
MSARRLALLVVATAGLMLLLAPLASADAPPNAAALEAELVCPTCKTTLDQSDAPIARRMKAIIRERIAAGASAAEIKQELVEQFGPGVLSEPPRRGFDLLAWLLPLVGIALGAVVVAGVAWAWRGSRRPDEGTEPLDAESELRVDEALGRFDG